MMTTVYISVASNRQSKQTEINVNWLEISRKAWAERTQFASNETHKSVTFMFLLLYIYIHTSYCSLIPAYSVSKSIACHLYELFRVCAFVGAVILRIFFPLPHFLNVSFFLYHLIFSCVRWWKNWFMTHKCMQDRDFSLILNCRTKKQTLQSPQDIKEHEFLNNENALKISHKILRTSI